ncbi:NodA family N-acyltransferase [Rhizobium sullae]|uniref:Nodulation protein A n=1 Tax=Rhizobium sullae TaxID=50338 RepID=A0A4R3PQI8_RHISU|nr:NodA family N-acyltransferase [Rhizobium sullae]TCU01907.1 beta-1,4-N-acetylglucosamine oligosaccharide N-acyltransferase NodA [Rhizobium sullae]UWU19410.1 NodA family N-acyltransferase [Rhizobium sullae]
MRSDVRWRLCWENDLQLADHAALSDFFRESYGRTGAFNTKPFEDGSSWAGARPEFRAIGYDAHGVAAHIGILRRFIKVGEVDLLVAELGLYGVRPDLERLGISFSLSDVFPALQQLRVPFAFGTVRHAMRNHMERLCRGGLATIVSGVRVRSTLADMRLDLPPTRVEDVLVVVVPFGRSMDEWPSGTLIDRNGPEL